MLNRERKKTCYQSVTKISFSFTFFLSRFSMFILIFVYIHIFCSKFLYSNIYFQFLLFMVHDFPQFQMGFEILIFFFTPLGFLTRLSRNANRIRFTVTCRGNWIYNFCYTYNLITNKQVVIECFLSYWFVIFRYKK